MFSGRQNAHVQEPPHRAGGWRQETLSSTAEVDRVVQGLLDEMADEGYPKDDLFRVRLALEEACINAIKHGHQNDPRKRVRVRYRVDAERVLAEVQDQGPGFDPHQLADPRATENLDRPSGRGVLLMRSFMTWVRYNQRGNAVTLCQCRSGR